MSANDGSSEPARAGKGDHCHYKIRRLLGDSNNDDDDRLYAAAALLSTITKTSDGDPDKPEIDGPNFFTKLQPLPPTVSDSTLLLPNDLDKSAIAAELIMDLPQCRTIE